MNFLDTIESSDAVLLALFVGLVILILLQMRSNSQVSKITFPAYEFTMKKAQAEADKLLGEARKQAREIIAKAELESQTMLALRSEESVKDYRAYSETLKTMKDSLSGTLSKLSGEAETSSREMSERFVRDIEAQSGALQKRMGEIQEKLEDVPRRIEAQSSEIAESIRGEVRRVGEELRSALAETHRETTALVRERIEKSLSELESDIETYRRGRRNLIDNHIETLVRDIVRIALGKELEREDHAKLVRSALEEAKRSGIF